MPVSLMQKQSEQSLSTSLSTLSTVRKGNLRWTHTDISQQFLESIHHKYSRQGIHFHFPCPRKQCPHDQRLPLIPSWSQRTQLQMATSLEKELQEEKQTYNPKAPCDKWRITVLRVSTWDDPCHLLCSTSMDHLPDTPEAPVQQSLGGVRSRGVP